MITDNFRLIMAETTLDLSKIEQDVITSHSQPVVGGMHPVDVGEIKRASWLRNNKGVLFVGIIALIVIIFIVYFFTKNDGKKDKKQETPVKTTNQAIMGEIRNFMDTANKGYEIRKKREQLSKEKYEKTVEFYNKKIKEKVAFACNIWKDAPKSCWLDKEVISVLMKYKINDPNGLSGKTFHGFYFTPHT